MVSSVFGRKHWRCIFLRAGLCATEMKLEQGVLGIRGRVSRTRAGRNAFEELRVDKDNFDCRYGFEVLPRGCMMSPTKSNRGRRAVVVQLDERAVYADDGAGRQRHRRSVGRRRRLAIRSPVAGAHRAKLAGGGKMDGGPDLRLAMRLSTHQGDHCRKSTNGKIRRHPARASACCRGGITSSHPYYAGIR